MTGPRLDTRDRLDPPQARAVTRLVDDATDADGVRPVSDQVLHRLVGGTGGRHLLLYDGDALAGYAHVAPGGPAGPVAELAVDPARRRRGHGGRLLAAARAEAGGAGLRAWAHGDRPGAAALARAAGLTRDRVLVQLRRPLDERVPAVPLPGGVTLRGFAPGRDEAAWVAVNNRAFADHPDQGAMTLAALRALEREPWFDACGFLLAERAGELLGFHWTKVHPAGANDPADTEPVGEVYVVGVDPAAQGLGLGPALTAAGLGWLRSRGLTEVLLYVDESNARAVGVYRRLGFTDRRTDVCYRG